MIVHRMPGWLAWSVAALAHAPAPAPAQAPSPPARPAPVSPVARAGTDFVAAMVAGDERRMRDIADFWYGEPDAFLVADWLLVRRQDLLARDPADAERHLAAATRLAGLGAELRPDLQGLPRLVAMWSEWSADDQRRHREFRKAVSALFAELRGAGAPAAIERVQELQATAPPGDVYAVILLLQAGRALELGWQPEPAKALYGEAAAAAAAMGWGSHETDCLQLLGSLCARTGDYPRAVAAGAAMLRRYEEWGEPFARTAARMRGNLAGLYAATGDLQACDRQLALAADELPRWNDLVPIALLHGTAAEVLRKRGQPVLALPRCEQAFASFTESGSDDPAVRGYLHKQHGDVLLALGRFGPALAALEQAADLHRRIRQRPELVEDLLAVGDLHRRAADPARAGAATREALAVALQARDLALASRCQLELGRLADAGGHAASLQPLQQALAEAERVAAHSAALRLRRLLGEAERGAGRLADAIDRLTGVVALATERGELAESRAATLVLAAARLAHGEHAAAGADYEAVAAASADAGDRGSAAAALAGLTLARSRGGDHAATMAAAGRAVAAFNALGTGLGERLGLGLRGEVRAAADAGLLAALELQRTAPDGFDLEPAWQLCESARALLLVDALGQRDGVRAAQLPAELLAAEQQALARVVEQHRQLLIARSQHPGDAAEKAARRAAVDASFADYDRLRARLQRERAELAAVEFPSPVPLSRFQRALPQDLAFVAWHVAGDQLLAFVVRRERARLLGLGAVRPLAARAETWRLQLARPDAATAELEQAAASALHEALVAPLTPWLGGGVTRLWLSPDGALACVPFEALRAGGGSTARRLVEEFETTYVPSATVGDRLLAAAPAPDSSAGFLALGDPDYSAPPADDATPRATDLRDQVLLRRLPHSRAEVEQLARWFPDHLPAVRRVTLLDKAATLANLRAAVAAAPRPQVVHLACHGLLDPRCPELGGLVLAGGEILSCCGLGAMELGAGLLVLSACDTARGQELPGEGVLGLVRAGLLAGCRRQLVSHWQVEDERTARFMADFYRRHLGDGLPAATALREARRERLRAGGDGAQPGHWSAFVLWGLP